MPKLSSVADNRNDWMPPSLVGKRLPAGMPGEALYSPSRRAWLIPSTQQIVGDGHD